MKVTLLFFEIISSHNYAPLRSAIHILKTLQEVFFWNGVQKSRPISLDFRNTAKYLFSFKESLSRGNRKQSEGVRSGEIEAFTDGSPHTKTIVIIAEIESGFVSKDNLVPFRCSPSFLIRGTTPNGGVDVWELRAADVIGAAIPNVFQPGAFVWFEKTQGYLVKKIWKKKLSPQEDLDLLQSLLSEINDVLTDADVSANYLL
ncbi:uncharacterized protein TNCV_3080421 [Trichonephila clavipes]|nr:uncharacterized protein TNCV_3080421 [Trichonephila clavipes]